MSFGQAKARLRRQFARVATGKGMKAIVREVFEGPLTT